MAVLFNCPYCAHELRANDQMAGKRVRCNECGQLLIVPIPPSVLSATAEVSEPLKSDEFLRELGQSESAESAGHTPNQEVSGEMSRTAFRSAYTSKNLSQRSMQGTWPFFIIGLSCAWASLLLDSLPFIVLAIIGISVLGVGGVKMFRQMIKGLPQCPSCAKRILAIRKASVLKTRRCPFCNGVIIRE